jgi:hypothetical protein
VSRHGGLWRGFDDVEYARFEWVAWFNQQRLLKPLGYLTPTEFEQLYRARAAQIAGRTQLTEPAENLGRFSSEPYPSPLHRLRAASVDAADSRRNHLIACGTIFDTSVITSPGESRPGRTRKTVLVTSADHPCLTPLGGRGYSTESPLAAW